MKIVVAYKWAPNPQDASVGVDGIVDWSRAKPGISEYDPVAIELARRLADATGAGVAGGFASTPSGAPPRLARDHALPHARSGRARVPLRGLHADGLRVPQAQSPGVSALRRSVGRLRPRGIVRGMFVRFRAGCRRADDGVGLAQVRFTTFW